MTILEQMDMTIALFINNNKMRKVVRTLACFILGHKWTSDAAKGIKPTDKQILSGYDGFKNYSKMYCDRCGTDSKLNDRL